MFLCGGNTRTFCGFHSPVLEKSSLQECDFASLDKWFPIFRRNVRGHFTSYAESHPKILKYWLKLCCIEFKTIRRKNLCPLRFLGALAKLWKNTIILVMPLCLSARLSTCLPARMPVCPSDCVSARMSVWLCLSVCPSILPHEKLVFHWTDFHERWYWIILRNSVEEI
jgi:hypothetical protein